MCCKGQNIVAKLCWKESYLKFLFCHYFMCFIWEIQDLQANIAEFQSEIKKLKESYSSLDNEKKDLKGTYNLLQSENKDS